MLLVEDDDGDALLVRELLDEVAAPVVLTWVRSLAEAEPLLARTDCVLLDLGLSDASGLDGLRRVQARAPGVAVLVLTGYTDEQQGVVAVGAGAQDYLVKGQVDGTLLARVIQYAIERRRSDEDRRQLREERLLAEEKARLERGLLPSPVLSDPAVSISTRYQAGQRRMLIGGDFYDVVQAPDAAVHVVIGDVSGHGPDEAALGVCLRVAWRTMVLAGRPVEETLSVMQQVLVHERQESGIFATLCTVAVAPDRASCRLHIAGHPPPLLITPAGSRPLTAPIGLPLGVLPDAAWTGRQVSLGERWALLLFTDGLVEGRVGAGSERLGDDRLQELVDDHIGRHPDWWSDPITLVDSLIRTVEDLNGGALVDDVAALLVTSGARGD